jgi:hypothetical protein
MALTKLTAYGLRKADPHHLNYPIFKNNCGNGELQQN